MSGARFKILETLGQGSMGDVYRAVQVDLGREVALKIIRPEIAGNKKMLSRFKREAQAASRLIHPNIVRIFDSGQVAGKYYIAMEMVQGHDLQRVVKERPREARKRSVEIIGSILAGVGALHEVGMVHRDLKPANVMVDQTGRTIVMDFGLVKDMEGDGTCLTQPGECMGTPSYMAPEILNGEPATAATDVWAIGCIWYDLVTGTRLFDRPSMEANMMAILHDPMPDLAVRCPDLSLSCREILARCLARNPEDRFSDAPSAARGLLEARNSQADAFDRANPEENGSGYSPITSLERRSRGGPPVTSTAGSSRMLRTLGLFVVFVVGLAWIPWSRVLSPETTIATVSETPTSPPLFSSPALPASPADPAVFRRRLAGFVAKFANLKESMIFQSLGTTELREPQALLNRSAYLFQAGQLFRDLDTFIQEHSGRAGLGSQWFDMLQLEFLFSSVLQTCYQLRHHIDIGWKRGAELVDSLRQQPGPPERDLMGRWFAVYSNAQMLREQALTSETAGEWVRIVGIVASMPNPEEGRPRARLAEVSMLCDLMKGLTQRSILDVIVSTGVSQTPARLKTSIVEGFRPLGRLLECVRQLEQRPDREGLMLEVSPTIARGLLDYRMMIDETSLGNQGEPGNGTRDEIRDEIRDGIMSMLRTTSAYLRLSQSRHPYASIGEILRQVERLEADGIGR